jgi:hypothetical protein
MPRSRKYVSIIHPLPHTHHGAVLNYWSTWKTFLLTSLRAYKCNVYYGPFIKIAPLPGGCPSHPNCHSEETISGLEGTLPGTRKVEDLRLFSFYTLNGTLSVWIANYQRGTTNNGGRWTECIAWHSLYALQRPRDTFLSTTRSKNTVQGESISFWKTRLLQVEARHRTTSPLFPWRVEGSEVRNSVRRQDKRPSAFYGRRGHEIHLRSSCDAQRQVTANCTYILTFAARDKNERSCWLSCKCSLGRVVYWPLPKISQSVGQTLSTQIYVRNFPWFQRDFRWGAFLSNLMLKIESNIL